VGGWLLGCELTLLTCAPRALLEPLAGTQSGEKNERRKNPPGRRRRRRRRRRGARQRRGRRRRPRRRQGGQGKKRRAKARMMMMTPREGKLPIRPPMAYSLNRCRVSVCRRAISIKRGNTSKSRRHWPGFARFVCLLFLSWFCYSRRDLPCL